MSLNVNTAFESLYSNFTSSSLFRFDFRRFNGFFGRMKDELPEA
jgi:hypothetical protein